MGMYSMGVSKQLVQILKNKYDINTFVETGTYSGGTSVWAANEFEKVITIENSKPIYEKTSAQYNHLANIEFLFGHSLEHLKNIVSNLDEPAIFWLDAHWSGGETYGVHDECPLIEELKIINNSKLNHIILIDDARMFVKPPQPPHKAEQWPTISQIANELNKIKGRYVFVADDVIGAVPDDAIGSLMPYFNDVHTFEQNLVPKQLTFVERVKRKLKI